MNQKVRSVFLVVGSLIVGGATNGCTQASAHEGSNVSNQQSSGGQGAVTPTDGAATSESIVKEFDKLENRTSIDVDYIQGSQASAKLIGSPEDVKQIILRQDGSKLVIETTNNAHLRGQITAKLTSRVLKGFILSGSGRTHLDKLTSDQFSIALEGSGDVDATGSTGDLGIDVSGSGRLSLANLSAKKASVQLGGSGEVETAPSDSATISIGGSGTVNVGETKMLTVSIDGSGNVYYKGHPQVTQVINGSGSVQAR